MTGVELRRSARNPWLTGADASGIRRVGPALLDAGPPGGLIGRDGFLLPFGRGLVRAATGEAMVCGQRCARCRWLR
jgi:hypothetical protein